MVFLTLLRHGQTQENLSATLQGQSPGHLNATGISQAERLGEELSASQYDMMVCSDLLRTRTTAEIINRKLHLPINYTSLLRERDWGRFTGLYIRMINLKPRDFPPDVETGEQLAIRAKKFLTYILDNYDGKRLLCVGHGYFNRCIQAMIEQQTVHDTPRWGNVELRSFNIDRDVLLHPCPTDFLVSEN